MQKSLLKAKGIFYNCCCEEETRRTTYDRERTNQGAGD